MAAQMMNRSSCFVASPVACFRAHARPTQARRSALLVRAQDPATAPDSAVTPEEILAYAKTLPGISQPFPDIFDPLNLLSNATSIQEVRRWRESEITHGRVAMLATVGWLVGEAVADNKLLVNYDGRITGPAIDHFQQVESKESPIFWEPLVFAIGIAEAWRIGVGWAPPRSENFNQLLNEYNPGEIGFDPLGLTPTDPKEKYDLQTKELNNGRLAMIAIIAFIVQELIEKKEIVGQIAERTSPVAAGPNT